MHKALSETSQSCGQGGGRGLMSQEYYKEERRGTGNGYETSKGSKGGCVAVSGVCSGGYEENSVTIPGNSEFQGAAKGVRQKEFDHFFFRFRDAFGHFSVTFSDASVTFLVTFLPNSFCRTPFAAG